MGQSTKRETRGKSKFPLTHHKPTGQYRKRIRGKDYYFGKDRDTALAEWLRVKDALLAGRQPESIASDRLTIKDLANRFLTYKQSQVEIGELTLRSFNDYLATCEGLASALSKASAVATVTPEDLLKYRGKLAKRLGPTALGNEVNRCRAVFNYAFKNGLIEKPVRFGDFTRPRKSATRKVRAAKGSRLFDASELRQLIDAADRQLKPMILLGINAALGNADLGTLPIEAIDLDSGWLTFPRVKTGIDRRCKLWPETVQAIREYLPKRKEPKDSTNVGLLFVTKYGQAWHIDGASSPISHSFRKLLDKLELYRPGLSFYSLRRTLQTLGDELSGDYLAVKRIMGHADSSISDHYRERLSDDRLVKVVEHVHAWLFPHATVDTDLHS